MDDETNMPPLEDSDAARRELQLAIAAAERGLVSAGDLPGATPGDVLNLTRDDDVLPPTPPVGGIRSPIHPPSKNSNIPGKPATPPPTANTTPPNASSHPHPPQGKIH